MATILRLTLIAGFACLFTSCVTTTERTRVTQTKPAATGSGERFQKVRTTAYTHGEGSGPRNAVGRPLAGGGCKSAAADWSRFPVGTRFRVVSTGQEYVVDDYGTALIGTNTIDLYKDSSAEMHRWGVRHVDIEILQLGSRDESLKILRPRHRARIVRRMIASLETRKTS
ncbi:MAG TPA: 3D domain-containing protein [Chthoniobacterales bacterium]|nr:3D domain-containing protein [Chthoniobacterales bacterium]